MPDARQQRARSRARTLEEHSAHREQGRLAKTRQPEAHGQLPLLIPDPEQEPSLEELQSELFD